MDSMMCICICVYDRIWNQVKNMVYDIFVIFIKDIIKEYYKTMG